MDYNYNIHSFNVFYRNNTGCSQIFEKSFSGNNDDFV